MQHRCGRRLWPHPTPHLHQDRSSFSHSAGSLCMPPAVESHPPGRRVCCSRIAQGFRVHAAGLRTLAPCLCLVTTHGVEPAPSQPWDLCSKSAPHDQPRELGTMRGAWERLTGAAGRGRGGASSRNRSGAASGQGRARGRAGPQGRVGAWGRAGARLGRGHGVDGTLQ